MITAMEKLKIRQKQIVELVQSLHFMTIRQLSRQLQVSEMTIRRDIQVLSESNLLNQVFGGVTSTKPQETKKEYLLTQEQNYKISLKLKIAQKAMELLDPSEVVFFDSGTTVQFLAEQLSPDSVHTVITASFNTMEVLVKLPNITVISSGGVYSPKPKVFFNHDSGD